MTPVLFATVYAVLLVAITYLLAERIIDRLQSRPISIVISGNGVIDQVVDAIAQIAAQMQTAQTVTVPLRIIQAHPPSEP